MANVETAAGNAPQGDVLDKELHDAIVGAYDIDRLKQLVCYGSCKLLYKNVDWDKPFENVVFQVLIAANERGLIFQLLLCVKNDADQKDNADLQGVIGRHLQFAEAAQQSSSRADVRNLKAGISGLQAQVVNNDAVRRIVAASREKLDQLDGSIDMLFQYKEVHDCLHELQLAHYQDIIRCARQLGPDMQSTFELQQHILCLSSLCDRASDATARLPEAGAGRARIARSIDDLQAAIPKLQAALQEQDAHAALEACAPLRVVIEGEQARVNGRLNDTAEELPLAQLSEILTQVAAFLPPGPSAENLRTAIDSLQNIKARLEKSVAEHDRWQGIEPDFWEAGDLVEKRTAAAIEEFVELWPSLKSRVAAISQAQPESEWAKYSEACVATIEKTLADFKSAAAPPFEKLRGNFGLFHSNALYHFFQVDRDVKAQCAAILKIRQPLQELLKQV